ncbi:MAG: hypothetical protein MI924_25360 [Chloroflexales bacterium]|nr:hypothetical protein [Chloroflexales bacterium]
MERGLTTAYNRRRCCLAFGRACSATAPGATTPIHPLWHKLAQDEVISYSPTLADKLAIHTAAFTLDEMVDRLAEVIDSDY